MIAVAAVAVMAVVTALLRFLPFAVFRKKTPEYISYLGKVLPAAIIGMLVVYCLRGLSFKEFPYGIPELISAAAVVGMQVWKRSAVVSILVGTVLYMLLVNFIFK